MTKRNRYKSHKKARGSWWDSAALWESDDSYGETTSWLDKWDGSEFRKSRHRINDGLVKEAGVAAAATVHAALDRRAKGLHIEGIDSYIIATAKAWGGEKFSTVAYDRALRKYAEQSGKDCGLKGKALERHTDGFAASAALDLLTIDQWTAFAKYYIPDSSNGAPMIASAIKKVASDTMQASNGTGHPSTDRRMNQAVPDATNADDAYYAESDEKDRALSAKTGLRYDKIEARERIDLSGFRASAQYLATALEDSRREYLLSEWSGSRLGNDAALWASGASFSPFAEPDMMLGGLCDVLILVDASSSTIDDEKTNVILSTVAHDFAVALRGAGHGAAVVPWSHYNGGLYNREGATLWNDPIDSGNWPVWGWGGTGLGCATRAARMAFSLCSSGKRRKIALILTDGHTNGRPNEGDSRSYWNFGSDLSVLWAVGRFAKVPDDWSGPSLHSLSSLTMMDDLLASDAVRYLSGLSH